MKQQISIILLILVIFFIALGSASNEIAYISYYDSSNCDGNPYAVLPIFKGDYTFRFIHGGDCLISLEGITSSAAESETVTYTGSDLINVYVTVDGNDETRAFGDCSSSSTYDGCSRMYTQTAPNLSSSGDNIDEATFVGFLNYASNCPDSSPALRVPVFDGSARLCVDTSANNCVDQLFGFGLGDNDNDRDCSTNAYAEFNDCYFLLNGADSQHYGECGSSDTFSKCDFLYTLDSGYSTDTCGTTLTVSASLSVGIGGGSGSSATTLSASFLVFLITFLVSFC